ncbi:MAG: response regulator [Candidatus Omnitrophota bacterium]
MANKVLVVDDDPVSLELLRARLSANGYTVVSAVDGSEGLQKAKQDKPDLIVTDFMMPQMDGFTFFKELKKDEKMASIPIIVLTARAKIEDSFKVFGVDSFLTKPLNMDLFLSEVAKLTKNSDLLNKLSGAPTGTPEVKKPEAKTEAKPPEPKSKPAEPTKQPEPPKPVKPSVAKPSADVKSNAKNKVLIFGANESIMNKMLQELEGKKCQVTLLKDDKQLVSQAEKLEVNLIFLQVNAVTSIPVDQIVVQLSDLIRKKAKEARAEEKDEDDSIEKICPIILYKVEAETEAGTLSGSDLADMENLVQKCQEQGASKYIGLYSSLSFMSKIKNYLT